MKKLVIFSMALILASCAHGLSQEVLDIEQAAHSWQIERDQLIADAYALVDEQKLFQNAETKFLDGLNEEELEAYSEWYQDSAPRKNVGQAQLKLNYERLSDLLDNKQFEEWGKLARWREDFNDKVLLLYENAGIIDQKGKAIKRRALGHAEMLRQKKQNRRDFFNLLLGLQMANKLNRIEQNQNRSNWIYQGGTYRYFK